MDIETKELTTLRGTVTKLENRASAVSIETKENYDDAVDIVARLKAFDSELTHKKESITKPLNEALRNARSLFAPIEAQLHSAESIIKAKLLGYKRRIDEEAQAKEQAIAKKVEEGRMKLETAERKLDAIERIDNTTKGKIGEVQVRKIKKIRIENPELLPREYLIPNEPLIRGDALDGKVIPGVVVFEEEIIAAR